MNEPATEVEHKASQPKGKQYHYCCPQNSAHNPVHLRSLAFVKSATSPLTK